jgi:hypothetical protein
MTASDNNRHQHRNYSNMSKFGTALQTEKSAYHTMTPGVAMPTITENGYFQTPVWYGEQVDNQLCINETVVDTSSQQHKYSQQSYQSLHNQHLPTQVQYILVPVTPILYLQTFMTPLLMPQTVVIPVLCHPSRLNNPNF